MSHTQFFCKEDCAVIMGLNQFQVIKLPKIFFLVYFMINIGLGVRNELRATTDCICPNQNATYECTTIGGEFTLWNGSIIPPDCEVVLSHAQFFNDTSLCCCNDPIIVGKGLEITNNSCYTSLLTVFVTQEVNGENVSCVVDYGHSTGELLIDTRIITITTVPFLPPSDVQLIAANATELVFSWTPPSVSCPSLTYHIDTKKCGICPNLTNTTTVTCTNFTLSTVCTMKVYSITCGNLMSEGSSNVIRVNLTVPEIAGDIETVFYYCGSRLMRVKIQFQTMEQHLLLNDYNESAVNYTITYFDPNSGSNCKSITISSSDCENGRCSHEFDIFSSSCRPTSNISMSVLGTNVLGKGQVKTLPVFASGTNSFVDVKFSPGTKSVMCLFLNNQIEETQKECQVVITYGTDCGQQLGVYRGEGHGNSLETTPALQTVDGVTKYCFNATLSSIDIGIMINTTIVIEGTINLVTFSGGTIPYIVVVSLLCAIILGLVIGLAFAIGVIVHWRFCHR